MKKLKIGLLTLGLGISFLNADTCVGFTDVSDSDAICDDLTFAKESLWIGGYPDGSFKPNKKVNRAEFTKIVMNATHKQSLAGQDCFYDSSKNEYEIKSKEWYSGYVCEAKRMDIIKGRKDGLFHPNDNVNYVEALKIVLKALGFQSQEWLGTNWYDTYLTEANAMNLPIYPNEHLVTRGEMITLMRQVYSKHTQRALAEKEWKEICHAKSYHFYKLGKIPTCKEKWMMQLFYEVGIPRLNIQTSQIRYAMGNVQDTHDIALSTFKTIGLFTGVVGSLSDGVIASEIESIKILSGVAFDTIGTDVANVTGGVFDIGLSLMQESVNNGFRFLSDVQPSPLMYVSFGAKFGEIGTNVWGAYSLNQKIESLNNINIAIAYLEDFYQYGGENSLVAVNEAKVIATANMYDTIYHYALNKGYKNSWWGNEFNHSTIVDIVENIKHDVERVLQKCYLNGECLAQEQKDFIQSYNVYTINGTKMIDR